MTVRRAFIKQIMVLFTGLAGVTACDREETGKEEPGFTATNENLFNAFVDTIVPKDQDAGAVEAGVPGQLLKRFSKKPEEENNAQFMLQAIDDVSLGRFHTPFDRCTLAQREMVLDIISKSRDKKYRTVQPTILRLRASVLKVFYSSPTAWEMLAFSAPYPGGYPDFNKPPPV